jgi:glutathione S-transferase
MQKLTLVGTPLSHFTRKIRILLHELGIPFHFEVARNLLEMDAARYGQNPLMRVPTLIDGDLWLIESDHIARHIVATRAPHDPCNVLTPAAVDLNRLAVVNGIMAHEVTIILAARGGLDDVMSHTYFQKLGNAITSGLTWLDRQIDSERESLDYVDVATICMWDHLVHYALIPGLQSFQRITERVARFSARDSVAQTTPQASLAAAM